MPFSSTSTGMPPSEVTQSAIDQRVHFVRRLADRPGLVEHAGGGFGLHEARPRCGRSRRMNSRACLRVVRLAPRLCQPHHLAALAARHFADAVGEEAVASAARTSVPGSAKLATAASMPELPVPEIARLNSLAVEKA